MSNKITVIITANGEGSRMKGISPLPKHLLWIGGKRAVDHIRDTFPAYPVKVLTNYETPGHDVIKCKPTNSRRETLEYIREMKNVLIVDCDIIPVGCFDYMTDSDFKTDTIWAFVSSNPKYGGLNVDGRGVLLGAEERGVGHEYRASGAYFLKDVAATIERMTDPNSIAGAMTGAKVITENSFIRFGDVKDYANAVKRYKA